jgi:hypothetical protein
MSPKRISFLVLALLAIATAVALFTRPAPEAPPVAATPAPLAAKPREATPPPKTTPPTPAQMQAMAQSAQQPPPHPLIEIEEEDERTEKEQVDAALAQLGSADPEQRVEGAEQLGAYPTKEAEQGLVQALSSDAEASVRDAAAQSLGYVEKPSDATITALFSALEDTNEDVRSSALSTLEDYLAMGDEDSRRYRKIMGGLKAKATARSTPDDMREGIRDILADEASGPPP